MSIKKYILTYIHTYKHANMQTYKHTNIQTYKHISIWYIYTESYLILSPYVVYICDELQVFTASETPGLVFGAHHRCGWDTRS